MKKLFSVLLIVAMIASLGVTGAFAEEGELALDAEEVVVVEEEVVLEEAAVEEEVVVEENEISLDEATEDCDHRKRMSTTLKKVTGQAATCVAGWEDCYQCKECGAYFSGYETYQKGTSKKIADDKDGYDQWKTGDGKIKSTDPTKHSAESAKIEAKAATCVEDGLNAKFEYQFPHSTKKAYDVYSCPDCGAWFIRSGSSSYATIYNLTETEKASLVTEKLGHDLEDVAGLAATCTTDGYEAAKQCKREGCKAYFTTDEKPIENYGEWKTGAGKIEALGHDLEDVAGLAATCTTDGYEAAKQCKREGCKAYFTTDEKPIENYDEWKTGDGKIEALDHDMKLAGERLEPTCTKAGHLAYYQCNRNGCKLYFYKLSDLAPAPELRLDSATADEFGLIGDGSETALNEWLAKGGKGYIAPLGHNMGAWSDTGEGTHTRACQREGCEYKEFKDHEFKNGKCTVCGAKQRQSVNLLVYPVMPGQNVLEVLYYNKPLYTGKAYVGDKIVSTVNDLNLEIEGKEGYHYDTWYKYNARTGSFSEYGENETFTLSLDGSTYVYVKYTACVDANSDHLCDTCKGQISQCVDEDDDHLCDICGGQVSECVDTDNDHLCDTCGGQVSECVDEDDDHLCDICGGQVSECVDEDDDHLCDICGEQVSECVDKNSDHLCDICGEQVSECVDKNSDHLCDICGGQVSQCVDENSDHMCDICGEQVSECVDKNSDHMCDICGEQVSEHSYKLVKEQLDPTCTEAGHLAYYQCETCKLYFFKTDDLSVGRLVPEEERLQLDSKAEYTLIGDKAALNKWLAEGGDGYLAPLGHDMSEWKDSENGKTHTRACQREGCKYTEKEKHVYKDGVCEICGAKEAKPAPAPKKPPKTGDESNAALWAVLVLGLGSGATAVVLKKKHN